MRLLLKVPSRYAACLRPFLKDLEEDSVSPGIPEAIGHSGLPADEIVILGRNENPYGPSPKVIDTRLQIDYD